MRRGCIRWLPATREVLREGGNMWCIEGFKPVRFGIVNGFLRLTTTAPFSTGSAVLDTRSLGTGTYICHISANGKLVGVTKFMVH